jgi:FMN phosphatase YigB (HAD superfamily)
MDDKLLIVDCDGVLYHPSELDINAMVYAFNDVCDDFGLKDEKFNYIENCTRDKPISGFYNYIASVAQKVDVPTEDFILKMVAHIDYSHIKADSDGILQKLARLSRKYRVCICTNNHLAHLNHVLKAKFNIEAKDLPFAVFDMRFAEKNGDFYTKESPVFVAKLEQYFGIPAHNFVWIDDNPNILEKVKSFGSQSIQVTDENRLKDILQKF